MNKLYRILPEAFTAAVLTQNMLKYMHKVLQTICAFFFFIFENLQVTTKKDKRILNNAKGKKDSSF